LENKSFPFDFFFDIHSCGLGRCIVEIYIDLVGALDKSEDFIRRELLKSLNIEVKSVRKDVANNKIALSGLTVVEYFRDDQGQDVLLFIDNVFRVARFRLP